MLNPCFATNLKTNSLVVRNHCPLDKKYQYTHDAGQLLPVKLMTGDFSCLFNNP